MAIIIDGKKLAGSIKSDITQEVIKLKKGTGVTPGLAAVVIGDDPGRLADSVPLIARFIEHLPEGDVLLLEAGGIGVRQVIGDQVQAVLLSHESFDPFEQAKTVLDDHGAPH